MNAPAWYKDKPLTHQDFLNWERWLLTRSRFAAQGYGLTRFHGDESITATPADDHITLTVNNLTGLTTSGFPVSATGQTQQLTHGQLNAHKAVDLWLWVNPPADENNPTPAKAQLVVGSATHEAPACPRDHLYLGRYRRDDDHHTGLVRELEPPLHHLGAWRGTVTPAIHQFAARLHDALESWRTAPPLLSVGSQTARHLLFQAAADWMCTPLIELENTLRRALWCNNNEPLPPFQSDPDRTHHLSLDRQLNALAQLLQMQPRANSEPRPATRPSGDVYLVYADSGLRIPHQTRWSGDRLTLDLETEVRGEVHLLVTYSDPAHPPPVEIFRPDPPRDIRAVKAHQPNTRIYPLALTPEQSPSLVLHFRGWHPNAHM
ncbi:hypothetical protein [Acanthopleuribacter pedis]|uniref:Uncharacterized protein n=1 Tax=Acanthopleuribacter pedis TaxID=442870 RepID=A0A8J7QK27_9BACT|nr:hypothetical protein [Acanthopleuribacter pedis]MBO1321440.1 hypothetical protein [Acanthopleuribacter pedis]